MKRILILAYLFIAACKPQEKEEVDLIVVAQSIYTGDSIEANAMAVKDGKILKVASAEAIRKDYQSDRIKTYPGAYVYPGFNDAHAHFLGYARGLGRVNLVGTQSWQECLERTLAFAEANETDFIVGRGWDQNDWAVKEFPDRVRLDSLFPNTPVVLNRIDGHAAIANGAALEYAGITEQTMVEGGKLLLAKAGLSGVLIDNAVDLIDIPEEDDRLKELVLLAQENCLAAGITSITDAGLKKKDIEFLRAMSEAGELKLRLNMMVSDDSLSLAHYLSKPPIEGERFRVKSAKFYLDGALGSRGALMLDAYSDDPGNYGLQLKPRTYFETMADSLVKMGWQMCVHAIGDSANRLAVQIFSEANAGIEDHRWRIEHAQIVHPEDQAKMAAAKIIPSIQPTHATSDMYWAEDRIGERIEYAYVAKSFLEQGLSLPLGTDFPVEEIYPMNTLRSAMLRMDVEGYPPGGFRPQEALSFDEAIKGMTQAGAYASFEEDRKGKLMPGYYADFIVFDRDISKLEAGEFRDTKPQSLGLNGEILY